MTTLLKIEQLITPLQVGHNFFNVVDKISFELHAGKTLALVGESGCGKSMTALSIMKILPKPPALPSKGKILFQDKNLIDIPEREMQEIRGKSIAMIFQDPTSALNPVYTIGDQLREVCELHLSLFGEAAQERCLQVLTEVGISSPLERLDDYPHQLSGGMKQRIMIAMALICEPEILIADEPTTALDTTIQAQVLDLIKKLQKEKNMGVLLITHDMGVVAEIADEVIVMYASQGVERGTVNQIFDHMAHPYTVGLFNSRSTIEKNNYRLTPIKGNVPPLTEYPSGCRFHPRCPFAMEKCLVGEVPEFEIEGDVGHFAACWLHDGSIESQEKLKINAVK